MPGISQQKTRGGSGSSFPAVNSDWVLPGYPTLLAAIQIDKTGTTRIGKWVVDHSFFRPGIVTVVVAIAVGFLLAKMLLVMQVTRQKILLAFVILV